MKNNKLSYKKFCSLIDQGFTTIPVFKRILADTLTPVGAWMKLSVNSNEGFILESAEKGLEYSRYSYVGCKPTKTVWSNNHESIHIIEKNKKYDLDISILGYVKNSLESYNCCSIANMPDFTGGFIGYLGYESISCFEKVPVHSEDVLGEPGSLFMLFDDLISFDHLKGEAVVISNVHTDSHSSKKLLYKNAIDKIDQMGNQLHADIEFRTPVVESRFTTTSNFNKDNFISAVDRAKNYIEKGDIFQVVISQCFKRHTHADPLNIYRALRNINPSPYLFHIKYNEIDIVGASPEILVKVKDKKVDVRPIAGTRPRGMNVDEDNKLAEELINDPKECSEHLMLLDLGRNDIGKVCDFGSIQTTDKMIIEKYSHVMHIVSNVSGILSKKYNSIDALISSFPAGTVSGAPKIRAMEIINELEPSKRGIYSGAVGYIDFNSNINTCIAIRMMMIKDGVCYFQAGAGIVHDSKSDAEFEETKNKAKVLNLAIDLAEDGLIK